MPRSNGRSWTSKTTSLLFSMTREGHTQKEIAVRLRRTPKAIESKVRKIRKALTAMPFPELVNHLQ